MGKGDVVTLYISIATDGYKDWDTGYWFTESEAKQASDYGRFSTGDFLYCGDGVFRRLGAPMECSSVKKALKNQALAKLTPAEKKALGL